MSRISISYEQVAEVADKISLQGLKPGARNIRDVLGAGIHPTICFPYLGNK